MSQPVLATKLYVPPPRPGVVTRSRLVDRLDEGLARTLTVVSAPAGFGKTTLVSQWVAGCGADTAWLSLDERDNDPTRFLTYLVGALQTVAAGLGTGLPAVLRAPQPPPVESVLTALLNDVAAGPTRLVVVLDDYHVITAQGVHDAVAFLVDRAPARLHLVIATREDPPVPLARLRAGNRMTELRVTDLRFTRDEAGQFLNDVMHLDLTPDDVAALETRAEGWIAGLQLAAISLRGRTDPSGFVRSFAGSHHFVMDYLVEEVLARQPGNVQDFLVRTAILDRLCGPLCDAVLESPAGSGQRTLEQVERANLFVVPLDEERRWYRYHHLFADLLRQRLLRTGDDQAGYHRRASRWYEDSGLPVEAFQHAVAARDVERALRLVESPGIPLHFRGTVTTILDWLASLPATVFDGRPSLLYRYASLLLVTGRTTGVDATLRSAEAALPPGPVDDTTRHLIGKIASARATLAFTRYDVATTLAQSHRALEYLHPRSRGPRTTAHCTLGFAHYLSKDRPAARRAFTEAISLGEASGDVFTGILATIGLGNVQEGDHQLHEAAQTYRRVLRVAGDQPLAIVHEAHLGLARVCYEWNDLDDAERLGRQSLHLAKQYERVIDRFVLCEVFLARVTLARGDAAGAAAALAEADRLARRHDFTHRLPEIAAAQVLTALRQGDLAAADRLAQAHPLPICQARVHLARGETGAALAVLAAERQEAETNGWADQRLAAMLLQALAHQADGDDAAAGRVLGAALVLAEPAGLVRSFVDEGAPMARLLSDADAREVDPVYTAARGSGPTDAAASGGGSSYVGRLLAAFPAGQRRRADPLSHRELEVLRLIAHGLSNHEIAQRLFLALDTVKGHNRKIFEKLGVNRRTEAVARARERGLL